MCVCMYEYIYICVYMYIHTYIYMYTYIYIYIYIYTPTHRHTHKHILTHTPNYTHTHIYLYVYMYICIYIHQTTYISTHTHMTYTSVYIRIPLSLPPSVSLPSSLSFALSQICAHSNCHLLVHDTFNEQDGPYRAIQQRLTNFSIANTSSIVRRFGQFPMYTCIYVYIYLIALSLYQIVHIYVFSLFL